MTKQQHKAWYRDVAEVIVRERKRHGWKQGELARRAGVYQGRLSLIEHGQVEASVPQLLDIFEALGLSFYVDTFFIEPDLTPPAE